MKKALFLLLFAAGLGLSGGAVAFLLTSPSFLKPSIRTDGGAGGGSASAGFRLAAAAGQGSAGAAASSSFKMHAGLVNPRLAQTPAGLTKRTVAVDPAQERTITLNPASGAVTIEVPAGCFELPVRLTARITRAFSPLLSNIASFRGTPIGVELTNDRSLQPRKPVTLRFRYRDSDVAGMDEGRLRIVYYLEDEERWVPIPSTTDPASNEVTGRAQHFTVFRVVEWVPAAGLAEAFIYPNPLRPSLGHAQMNITRLPADVEVKIFTLSGELVAELRTDSTGRATWDGLTKDGGAAASGVYLALLRRGSETKTVKIAVER